MPGHPPSMTVLLGSCVLLVACQPTPQPTAQPASIAPQAVAQAEPPLDEGPTVGTLVYSAPSAKPPRVVTPKPPKPKTIAPERPPQPTGPSPALLAAQAELEAVRNDLSEVRQAEANLTVAQGELRTESQVPQLQRLESELQSLQVAREIELQQVRDNQCCSVCGQTKTELEKSGKRFEVHLTEVKGTVAKCSPAKLAAVQKKYDDRIVTARARAEQARAQVRPRVDAAKAKVDAAQVQVNEAKRRHAERVREAEAKVQRLSGGQ